jgi:hypothetical protein
MKILKGIVAILLLWPVYFVVSYILGIIVGFTWGITTSASFPEPGVYAVCITALVLSIFITAKSADSFFSLFK